MVNSFETIQELIKEAAGDPVVSKWPVVSTQATMEDLCAIWRGSLILTFEGKVFVVRNSRVFDSAQGGQLRLWLQEWGTNSCKLYDAWWMVNNAKAAALGVIQSDEASGTRADGLTNAGGLSVAITSVVRDRKLVLGISVDGGEPEVCDDLESLRALLRQTITWEQYDHWRDEPNGETDPDFATHFAAVYATFGERGGVVVRRWRAVLGDGVEVGPVLVDLMALGAAVALGNAWLTGGFARLFFDALMAPATPSARQRRSLEAFRTVVRLSSAARDSPF